MRFSDCINSFVSLFYPSVCVCCSNSLVRGENTICMGCLQLLPRTNLHLQNNNQMEKRFWGKADIHRATALYYFNKESNFRHLLHLLKYDGQRDIGVVLGEVGATDFVEHKDFRNFDFIVPVPLHIKKLQQRGYNQSLSICIGIANITKVAVESNNLYRSIENPTQTKKTTYQRWENTKGIFAIKDPKLFENKHILLVDDVLTTGSTIISCVEALKETPNIKISVFTVAIA